MPAGVELQDRPLLRPRPPPAIAMHTKIAIQGIATSATLNILLGLAALHDGTPAGGFGISPHRAPIKLALT